MQKAVEFSSDSSDIITLLLQMPTEIQAEVFDIFKEKLGFAPNDACPVAMALDSSNNHLIHEAMQECIREAIESVEVFTDAAAAYEKINIISNALDQSGVSSCANSSSMRKPA